MVGYQNAEHRDRYLKEIAQCENLKLFPNRSSCNRCSEAHAHRLIGHKKDNGETETLCGNCHADEHFNETAA